jgi:hypothetical protein
MRNIMMSLILIVSCTVALSAQEASIVFHPRDPIHILVEFKTPPPPLQCASYYFSLMGQPGKSQQSLDQGFGGGQVRKISDTEFEISGTIPEHIASGNFRLSRINVAINDVGKQYSQDDFKELTIAILNPERPEFPVIGDVKLVPRQ